MSFFQRQIAYASGALAVVSGIAGILSWWIPASAIWLNQHGFIAWPLAGFFLISFGWAASNWRQSRLELANAYSSSEAIVPGDRRAFESFKGSFPRDSPVFYWLAHGSDSRVYRLSDITPLNSFAAQWRTAGEHFVNSELERALKQLVSAVDDFLVYQGLHSWAPSEQQDNDDDVLYRVYRYEEVGDRDREIQLGLGSGQTR